MNLSILKRANSQSNHKKIRKIKVKYKEEEKTKIERIKH